MKFGTAQCRKYDYKKMLLKCSLIIIVLMLMLHFLKIDPLFSLLICIVLAICFSCLYAILPFILTDLFPSSLRFTGIALTFNIADSFEGFTPVAALFLLHLPAGESFYFWILIVCAIISFCSYLSIRSPSKN